MRGDRTVVKDYAPSTRPEAGEIIRHGDSVKIGCGGGYLDLQSLSSEVARMKAFLGDPDFLDMVAWFKEAKLRAKKLGIPVEELKDLLF